jgi:hypothetical protein
MSGGTVADKQGRAAARYQLTAGLTAQLTVVNRDELK